MGALAKKEGLGTVYVTNGYITEEALGEIGTVLDAFRVDIKAFSDDFYKKVCGAKLQPVLDATVKGPGNSGFISRSSTLSSPV